MKLFHRNKIPRSQVKLAIALTAHADGSRIYGYELSRAARVRSGAMYPFLQKLHESGALTGGWEHEPADGRPPRRYYQLTALGWHSLLGLLADAQQDDRFDRHADDIVAALNRLRPY